MALAGVQHLAPGLGEEDFLAQLFGERQAEDDLDALDLHRDGRLGQMQFLGRPGKRKMAGDRFKHAELAQRQSAHVMYKLNDMVFIITI